MIRRPQSAVEFRVLACVVGILCAAFAGLHIAWAWGWRTGLPVDAELLAGRPLFLAYEIVVGVLLFVAAAVCFLICRVQLAGRWHRGVTLLVLGGSQVALMRGVPALLLDVSALATDAVVQLTGVLANVLFVAIGACGLLIWQVMAGDRRVPAYR